MSRQRSANLFWMLGAPIGIAALPFAFGAQPPVGDAGLLVAAVFGLVLTAGAILRDTRYRAALLRITPSS